MILSKFQIINYKSCSNLFIELDKDNPNILIGINDCGKSTILTAIGLLFDDKLKFNFVQEDKVKKDLSNQLISEDDFKTTFENFAIPPIDFQKDSCFLVGELELEENDINDENKETLSSHLQWVLDKQEVKKIWLCRCFNNDDKTSSHYLLTPRGTDDTTEYYKEKATALSKISKAKSVEKVENENKSGRFSTLELLRAVMEKVTIGQSWAEYKMDKNFFPQYRYLDWNISMDQLTQFTKDTMQAQINEDLILSRNYANEQRKKAQEKLNKELDSFTSNFLKDIPNIEKLKANIFFDVEARITDFIINKKNSPGDIHIESQGEGIKRQIWFSLIKWNALNAINAKHKNKMFIWCFDEPETHLYPSAQRDFYITIKKTCAANVQSLISTHSTIFVDKTKIKSINKIDLKDGISNISKCSSVDDIFDSLRLKNSDFLFYDKFIVVEGDTEEALIPHFFKLVTGSSIETENIKIINLGGKDKLTHNSGILDGILGEFKKTENLVYYILDNDAKYKLTQQQIEKYNPTFIGIQDIEDSLASELWLKILTTNLEEVLRLTLEEINEIKASLATDKEEQANKKFYPAMINSIRKKLIALERDDYYTIDAVLPSKGNNSSKMIIDACDSVEVLPQVLRDKLHYIMASS